MAQTKENEQSNTVDKQAVQDLFDKIPWSSRKIREVLEIVAGILAHLQAGNEKAAMRAAVEIATHREDYDAENWPPELIRMQVHNCIRELDHYTDKTAVIKAAMAMLSEIQWKEKKLYKMQQQLRAIFQNLDARTKAILEIRNELSIVDGVTNPPTDYSNLLDKFDSIDLTVLKSETELAPLLDAYYMAREVNESL